jgi:hypothetical protein
MRRVKSYDIYARRNEGNVTSEILRKTEMGETISSSFVFTFVFFVLALDIAFLSPLVMSDNHNHATNGDSKVATFVVKAGLAQMLKGGVIMDVTTAEQV